MPTTRDWATTDFYALLGVAPQASDDQIAAAFRALAKELHPDAAPGDARDAASEERFKAITNAYDVLGDPATRKVYDEVRRGAAARVVAPGGVAPSAVRPQPAPPRRAPFTRTRARWVLAAGVVVILAGIAASALVLWVQRSDASVRDGGVATTARVVQVDGERRLAFVTADGRSVTAPEPLRSGQGDEPVGAAVDVVYDPDDPTRVVYDASTLARDLTLWIVAVKLLVCGPILVWLGGRRLLRDDATA